MSHNRWLPGVATFLGLIMLIGSTGHARSAPSPRTVVETNGMSVVLVASDGHISAYVDRVADNAPVADATLGLRLRGSGIDLDLRQVSPGLFTAPFLPSARDSFMVTLERAGERSQVVADLAREDGAADAPAAAASSGLGRLAWLVLGLTALVALLALAGSRYLPAMLGWRPISRHAN